MFRTRKRADRKVAFATAKLRVDEDWTDITIANVSATGLMGKCACPPAVGTRLEIRKRGIAIVGEVVWAGRTRFGLVSDEEIDCTAFLARSDLRSDRRASERGDSNRRSAARWWCWQAPRDSN